MSLRLDGGRLYLNNVSFSFAEEFNGRGNLRSGSHQVTAMYSEQHERVLPHVENVGWLGLDPTCAVVLGEVRIGGGLLPCLNTLERLLDRIVTHIDTGGEVRMEIER